MPKQPGELQQPAVPELAELQQPGELQQAAVPELAELQQPVQQPVQQLEAQPVLGQLELLLLVNQNLIR